MNSAMKNIGKCIRLSRCVKLKRYGMATVGYSSSAQSSPVIDHTKLEEELARIKPREYRKKSKIVPPMKGVIVDTFDKELLAFPEVLNKEEMTTMNSHVGRIEEMVNDGNVNYDEICSRLREMRMYGAPVTGVNGGLESIITERCKYLEALAVNVKSALSLKTHWSGIDAVILGLQSDRKDAILSNLATGEVPITVCLREKMTSIPTETLECRSYKSIEGDWRIQGEKLVNDCRPGYYVVTCSAEHGLSNILVDPTVDTVILSGNRLKFIDTPGVLLGEITSVDNMKTQQFMKSVIAQDRLGTAAICLGVLRSAITAFIMDTRGKYSLGKPLGEFPLIQNAVCAAVSDMYAIESMVYFTAGLIDEYEDHDMDVECCLCRIYATRQTVRSIENLIEAIGIDNLSESNLKFLDDARYLLLNEEHNDAIAVYCGLSALHYGINHFAETVKAIRNYFEFPKFVLNKMLSDRGDVLTSPKLKLHLQDNLHPSFQEFADMLEYGILRLKYGAEKLFTEHGIKIVEQHRGIVRFAEASAHVYASMCSLSRASRSYCIGLYNSQSEVVISGHITRTKESIIKNLINDIDDGSIANLDLERQNLAEKSIQHGRSHYEHCLERVYF